MIVDCPCGSNLPFEDCCQPFLLGNQFPLSAEALMRSRYTAYSQANIDYILHTMRGPALQGFNPHEAKQWAHAVEWQKLRVIRSQQESVSKATVEFMVYFKIHQQPQIIYEISEFQRSDERWYYISGVKPKVSRNLACPCGSGKKTKHCCWRDVSPLS